MKISAFASRYNLTLGEGPDMVPLDPDAVEAYFGRDPFESVSAEGVSENLLLDPEGTFDGHNVMRDSTFMDSIMVDKNVPLSPLFVKDLAGRMVYIGFGPDRKDTEEWNSYILPDNARPDEEKNPFLPVCVFPRFCRSTSAMVGRELLEQVFLTKFRCLEMSMGHYGRVSGSSEEDPLVSATYLGANLYPYKLRLDTFYGDGFKLPQTQMVFARGDAEGINVAAAKRLGDDLLDKWRGRAPGTDYVTWLENLGDAETERLFNAGCTLMPTFEACNGYHVVGRQFELEDYWPGRAVMGLHDVVETRGDKAPEGTILDVLEPGFVTGDHVHLAKVIVSDGSGYVSPNAEDPEPLVPNLNLPHQRLAQGWRMSVIPTHPKHFEEPALWGWAVGEGRFLQLSGPVWDPLHYYYESVDLVLAAFEATPLPDRKGFVAVPEGMEHRFYPVIPMTGFDTFSEAESKRRQAKLVLPQSCLKRVPTEFYSAGIGYHPMPAEYEFELDTYWFPELHPLNRDLGDLPADVEPFLAPVIGPQITVTMFKPTVDAPEDAPWFADEDRLMTQVPDPLSNYPQLMRYLVPDIGIESIVQLCPVPFLSDPGEKLGLPAPAWWQDEDGVQLDEPLALEEVAPGVQDSLWDVRQRGIQIVQMRHLVYRSNMPLYMLAWWYGWSVRELEAAMSDWISTSAPVALPDIEA